MTAETEAMELSVTESDEFLQDMALTQEIAIEELKGIYQRLVGVVDVVMPKDENGEIIGGMLKEWLEVACQAKVGNAHILRDMAWEYNQEEIEQLAESRDMLMDAGDIGTLLQLRERRKSTQWMKSLQSSNSDLHSGDEADESTRKINSVGQDANRWNFKGPLLDHTAAGALAGTAVSLLVSMLMGILFH